MLLPFDPEFKASWWCRNPHLQTLRPFLFNPGPRPEFKRERLELEDGDFLDIDWAASAAQSSPIVLIVHGLGGSSRSHYVRRLVSTSTSAGLRSVVMHHRGCGGEPNRLPRSYHAGDGRDVNSVLRWLKEKEPGVPLFAAGYSLGGSMLLHQLHSHDPIVTAASVVSVPLDLAAGADRMERGVSRMYQWHLLSGMKTLLREKLRRVELPFGLDALDQVRTFREFDDLVTAPLHGFSDANDYYTRCSPRQLLSGIDTPTLLIHAADDPLTTTAIIPEPAELSGSISFRLSKHGGHCGFVSGSLPFRPLYWAEQQIVRFFTTFTPAVG